ncbi:MAG: M23 family metallopeptidase [Gemmatimonadetes bacterium]|nr:M23 family metallopeptidase [Gemmatimonadota bacterium]NNF13590.1 M23 family metallopeptidase [Gemmatimonadota bacterium]NNL30234.1 M23 family metallopeptidase [Gemmatimonadota bacterium]
MKPAAVEGHVAEGRRNVSWMARRLSGQRRWSRPALCLAVLTLSACALPRWPVDARLTSGFGLRFNGMRPDLHRGVDLDVPIGTPVTAMAGGTVRFAGVQRGFGNVVWIDHIAGFATAYAHLSHIAVGQGDRVSAGQPVGLSGASGNVTGPHLHFEVWRWGRPVDPIPVLGGKPDAHR